MAIKFCEICLQKILLVRRVQKLSLLWIISDGYYNELPKVSHLDLSLCSLALPKQTNKPTKTKNPDWNCCCLKTQPSCWGLTTAEKKYMLLLDPKSYKPQDDLFVLQIFFFNTFRILFITTSNIWQTWQ